MKLQIEVNLDDTWGYDDEMLSTSLKKVITETITSEVKKKIKEDKKLQSHIRKLKDKMVDDILKQ